MIFPLFPVLLLFIPDQEPLSFETQIIDSTISIGYGLALGDVDGDGRPDILLADKKQVVWYRNGDWKKFVMAENLTQFDNVCIAASDLDGDGKVEVAVGAQWNPSETTDASQSGSVHFLVPPGEVTERWQSVQLHHEPTVHRMRWVRNSKGKNFLVVLPLHGRGNKQGEGEGVRILAYEFPVDVRQEWPIHLLSSDMHLTHNMDVVEGAGAGGTKIYVAGKEGIRIQQEPFERKNDNEGSKGGRVLPHMLHAAGEVRVGKGASIFATIEPMHGTNVVIYSKDQKYRRLVVDSNVVEGHALGIADFRGNGREQVVAGWRNPNRDGDTGIRLYERQPGKSSKWTASWLDKNGMACEDLQVLDMNGDGKPDVVASGRATKNVKIYWNRNSNIR